VTDNYKKVKKMNNFYDIAEKVVKNDDFNYLLVTRSALLALLNLGEDAGFNLIKKEIESCKCFCSILTKEQQQRLHFENAGFRVLVIAA